jgi:hypothetical protein
MTYKTSDIVALVRNLPSLAGGDEEAIDRFIRAVVERFPNAKEEDLDKALIVLKHEWELEFEEAQRQQDELEGMIKLLERHNIPENIPWSEAVRIAAGRGDPEAITYLAELKSVSYKISFALMHSAAARHPNWECVEPGRYVCLDDGGPQSTPESLIDWFQMTFPAEARVIEERASVGWEARNA